MQQRFVAKLEKIEDVRVQELDQTEIHPLQMTTTSNVRPERFVETYIAALAWCRIYSHILSQIISGNNFMLSGIMGKNKSSGK